MSETNAGRLVWYELMTSDPKAATSFYTEVVGWKTQPFGEGGDYTMWVGSQGPLGGVTLIPEQATSMGVPPHWMSHVEVESVDDSLAKARSLGATVHFGPHDIPEVGRYGVITDPLGAAISLFTPVRSMPPHDSSRAGEFTWAELLTTDQDAAFAFYSALFGWEKILDHDLGPMGVYRLFGREGRQLGGMFNKPAEMKSPPSWIYYIEVDDLDGAIARATSGGAKLLNGPMEVPGGARIAQLTDPQGATFALHTKTPSTA